MSGLATSERRALSVASPMALDGADGVRIWRVEAGRVDIFAIVERGGAPIGNRHFIRGAGPGDLLFAIAPRSVETADGETFCRLSAFTGAAAELSPVDPTRMTGEDIAEAIDGWLTEFSDAVTRAHTNRHIGGTAVAAGEEIALVAETGVKSALGVVWVQADDAILTLFGDPAHPCAPGLPVPLAGGGWVVATDDIALRTIDTAALLATTGWFDCVAAYHSAALAILTWHFAASHAEESRRVALSALRSRRAYDSAVTGFTQVLGRSGPESFTASIEEPLTASCRLVAQAMGFAMPVKAAPKGAPPAGPLERVVRAAGMPARKVTLYGAWWTDEIGPMIGFIRETNAPVALLPAGRRGYKICDPASGQSIPLDEAQAGLLSPTAFVLYPPLPDRPLGIPDLLRFGLKPSRGDIGVVLAMSVLGAVLGLAVPTAIGVLIDDLVPSHLKPQLVELGLFLVMVAITQVTIKIAGDLAQLRIFGRAGTRLQTAVVERTLRLSSAFLNGFSSADLAQRTLVIDSIRQSLNVVVVDSLLSGLFSVASLIYLLVLSPPVALVALAAFLGFVAASYWAGAAQIGALTENEVATAKASELAFQFVENISHLRAAGAEERAYARWAGVYAAIQRAGLRANKVVGRFAAFSAGYEILAMGAFFWVLALMRSPTASTGASLVMVAAYAQFIASSSALAGGLQKVVLLLPKFGRARVLLRASPEIDATKMDPGELSGGIEVSHLTFGYVEGSPPVLDDVSFTIAPGQMVAFVGASGCGKSTMMKLLLGFEQASMGSIFYDGQDLKKLDLRAVRRQIGVVLQNGKLMSGSIAGNILGVTGGTNEAAWDAARRAGFAEDVEAMPMGMHTVLTEGASTLSGGQAQRLLIARALIGKPRMLFLDEATSALDNRTQAVVTQSLQQLAGTRIVIAHRLSTVRRADCIHVFEGGRIVQSGTYAQLSAVPGPFADLAKRQAE